jgi:predicted nucleic acid-binding protein
MTGEILLDTNILVYAFDADHPVRREKAERLIGALLEAGMPCVSSQVLGEFFSVVSRRFPAAMDAATAATHVERFAQVFRVYDCGVAVTLEALRGVVRYRMPFYDAQIWAAARLNHVPLILTEDFADGSEIEGVRFANPFAEGFGLSAGPR